MKDRSHREQIPPDRAAEPTTVWLRAETVQPDAASPVSTEVVRHEQDLGHETEQSVTGGAVADSAGAGNAWQTGQLPQQRRRRSKLRQRLGSVLTVVLLAASGVVLYLRFHHAAFQETGVLISQRTRVGCTVDVTGRISTNGSAGTVSYQWLVAPDRQVPHPQAQSVIAGQRAAYVNIYIEGIGHGGAVRKVTLQVLGPDPMSASTTVGLGCR